MRHEDRPKTFLETIHAASFPVYGLISHPLDLSGSSYGLGISQLARLISVSLTFTSPRYSSGPRHSVKSQNLEIISLDETVQHQEKEHMIFELEDPSKRRFDQHHFSKEEQNQAGSPVKWEGILSLRNLNFSGKILHWRDPLHISTFLLKSEKSIVMGNAYGPSYDELVQLLKSLQMINHQGELLKQYQYEYENSDK